MPNIIITMPEREKNLEDIGFDRNNPRFKRAFERRSENDPVTENRPLNTREREDMADYDKAVADAEKLKTAIDIGSEVNPNMAEDERNRILNEMGAALADAEKRRTVKDSKPK